jgi:membrane associated rhomboid family serine protease
MDTNRSFRLTPWVTRLLIVNGLLFVLLATVFTAIRFTAVLQFDPARFTVRPWTALSYLFVHSGMLHLALNSVILTAFGPPVEAKLGSHRFIAFYLYCGIGAALFALGLSAVLRVDPFVGASGALYGVMVAYVLYWPEAQFTLFPLPVSVTARVVLLSLITADVILGVLGRSDIAHFAHLGGALAGYVFVRLQSLTARKPNPRPVPIARRPVVTPMRVHDSATELRPAMPTTEVRSELGPDEIDRVLDKIAQFGIESLTSQERRFLTEASEKRRREQS